MRQTNKITRREMSEDGVLFYVLFLILLTC
jgi:hypothetical protein